MMYSIEQLAQVLKYKKIIYFDKTSVINQAVIDTRSVNESLNAVFFALPGTISDGHLHLQTAHDIGIRNFVISKDIDIQNLLDSNIIFVEDVLNSLQLLGSHHRLNAKKLSVIGITGSNGKTIVKEWLYQMINDDYSVVKSPKSFNSQVGVALSLLAIENRHEIGIFEAGISKVDEMDKLEIMIRPGIGLFTNFGDAHDGGFVNKDQKLREKLKLFVNAKDVIVSSDLAEYNTIKEVLKNTKIISWGSNKTASLFTIFESNQKDGKTEIQIIYKKEIKTLKFPFSDYGSIENALNVCATLLHLGYEVSLINERLKELNSLELRLQVVQGINGSILINDAYINDYTSLKIALDLLIRQAGNRKKVLVISSILESGLDERILAKKLKDIIAQSKIDECHLIGEELKDLAMPSKSIISSYYKDVSAFNAFFKNINIDGKAVLFKGSRKYMLEKAFRQLKQRTHSARLQIDLQSLEHNLGFYTSYFDQKVKIMAVIKAGAYGTGSDEVAKLLQHKSVSYLAVAHADEGIELRKSGIKIPIAVLNPDKISIDTLIKYKLEPEIFDSKQLENLIVELKSKDEIINIHLKLDTGMNRLGLNKKNIPDLLKILKLTNKVYVKSIFSHLSSSEDENDDDFTNNQVYQFMQTYDLIATKLNYKPLRHILNTSGIIRFPQYAFDMVRIGLGLYGIDTTKTIGNKLEKVHTLSANVIQIKEVPKGNFIGYNRTKEVKEDIKAAILNIGYADGLMRSSGNGRYSVLINDAMAPIIGNISMDLTIVDISHIKDVILGTEAVIFGKEHPIEHLAEVNGTIPYEILTRIAPRVVRQYLY